MDLLQYWISMIKEKIYLFVRFLKLTIDTYDEQIEDYDYSKAKFLTYKKVKNVSEFSRLIKEVEQLEIDNEWYRFKDCSVGIFGDDEYEGISFNVYVEEYI